MYYLFQATVYKEDFKEERKDREKMHSELTCQLTISQGVAHDLQQKLIQSIHDKEHAYSHQCEDLKKNFEQKVGNLEEEKLVLLYAVAVKGYCLILFIALESHVLD